MRRQETRINEGRQGQRRGMRRGKERWRKQEELGERRRKKLDKTGKEKWWEEGRKNMKGDTRAKEKQGEIWEEARRNEKLKLSSISQDMEGLLWDEPTTLDRFETCLHQEQQWEEELWWLMDWCQNVTSQISLIFRYSPTSSKLWVSQNSGPADWNFTLLTHTVKTDLNLLPSDPPGPWEIQMTLVPLLSHHRDCSRSTKGSLKCPAYLKVSQIQILLSDIEITICGRLLV